MQGVIVDSWRSKAIVGRGKPKAGLLDYFDCKVHLVVESR